MVNALKDAANIFKQEGYKDVPETIKIKFNEISFIIVQYYLFSIKRRSEIN
jgi:hypothetical protein